MFQKLVKRHYYLILLIVTVGCFAVYYNSLNFEFLINFDDDLIVLNRTELKDFNAENLEYIFTHTNNGSYHPITSLSWMIEQSIYGLNARNFHLTNLLIHLMNGWLLFFFLSKLKLEPLTCLIAAGLFLIHPMHVENVVWVSSRKDSLFLLFGLLSLISSVNHSNKNSIKGYALMLLFFTLSLLSNSNAIVLPILFFLIDWLQKGLSVKKQIKHYAPLLLLSVVFVFIKINLQKDAQYISETNTSYEFLERVFLFAYSYGYYLIKFIVPFNLSPKNFYPQLDGGSLRAIYYVLALVPILIGIIIYRYKKHRKLIFAILFFSVSLLPVLEFMPTGNEIVFNKYAYLPFIGLYFLVANLIDGNQSKMIKVLCIVIIFVFGFYSYQYKNIFKNSLEVWNASIEGTQEKSRGRAMAINEKAQVLLKKGQTDAAFQQINMALSIEPELIKGLINRAKIYEEKKQLEKALKDLTNAKNKNPKSEQVLNIRGALLAKMGKLEESYSDLSKAIELQSESAELYNNRGITNSMRKNYSEAITDFGKAIHLSPQNAQFYLNRANLFFQMDSLEDAKSDLLYLKSIQPKNFPINFQLGLIALKQNRRDEAKKTFDTYAGDPIHAAQIAERLTREGYWRESLDYFKIAIGNEQVRDKAYYQRSETYMKLGEYQNAIDDLLVVIEHLPGPPLFHRIGTLYLKLNDIENACHFWKEAQSRNYKEVEELIEKYCN